MMRRQFSAGYLQQIPLSELFREITELSFLAD